MPTERPMVGPMPTERPMERRMVGSMPTERPMERRCNSQLYVQEYTST